MTKPKLYVFWQDQENRRWHPVGMLTRSSQSYRFVYTQGAARAPNFIPFGRMRDLHQGYESPDLFPIFSNRLLSSSRPDYSEYIRWLGAEKEADDPIFILSRTGGERATDNLLLYARPEPTTRNEFDLCFFCHGIRHLERYCIERVNQLTEGEGLYVMFDVMNLFDLNAVAIRTGEPACMVGYVPRFFANDVKVCAERNHLTDIKFSVMRVNLDAPLQLLLLCRFTCPWPEDFNPCSDIEYEPLVELTPELSRPRTAHQMSDPGAEEPKFG